MIQEIMGILSFGAFSIMFLSAMLLGLIEILGKIYATYHALVRNELSSEQHLIYLIVIWLIPLGWLIYLLLGKERTRELFSDVKIFQA